jgi:asparagine N-glycosylation enzyme membrane subunit Stt3
MVLLAGLGLRLWGVRQGLPYAYNTDEADHFVRHAVRMFEEGTLNPHYFANPPAFTYLLHYLFGLWYGGGAGVRRAFELHPSELYTLARIAAAVLGTLALWLLYATGARLLNRGVGLLAAAIEAVAFLPVFYAHLALNDVPTLAPLTLSLLGTAGVLRRGRMLDYLIAGAGVGLAAATKYTAGIVIVALLAAALAQYRSASPEARRSVILSTVTALLLALAAFVLANPYSVLDFHTFSSDLNRQSE